MDVLPRDFLDQLKSTFPQHTFYVTKGRPFATYIGRHSGTYYGRTSQGLFRPTYKYVTTTYFLRCKLTSLCDVKSTFGNVLFSWSKKSLGSTSIVRSIVTSNVQILPKFKCINKSKKLQKELS